MDRDALRRLPPVGAVLEHPVLVESLCARGRAAALRAVRAALEEARRGLRQGKSPAADPESLARRSREILDHERASVCRVINATGILLHTGLGRAPLAEEAVAAVCAVARGYCSLELELEEGKRSRRTSGIAGLLRELTGAEAATAVNNNAGATLLALRALSAGREVIVSRGQLVEIGGSFRLPEICAAGGARLREVGTTNKTRLSDYEAAIGPESAAILRVHRSNFRIVGFAEDVAAGALFQLAHARGLWAIDDIGSGALAPGRPPLQADEPTVEGGLAAGADLVLFSGDKLLGGPQCGILVGSAKAIALVESDPVCRALRLDKMTLAALEATLRLAADPERAMKRIPLWAMLELPVSHLAARAERLASILRAEMGYNAAPLATESFVGGGSAPFQAIATVAVAISPPFPPPHGSEAACAQALRLCDPPVVARIQKGRVLLDLRTVAPDDEPSLLDALRTLCHIRGTTLRQNGPGLPA